MQPSQLPDRLEPFCVWHEDVGNDEVRRVAAIFLQGVVTVGRVFYLMPCVNQDSAQAAAECFVVVDEENPRHESTLLFDLRPR